MLLIRIILTGGRNFMPEREGGYKPPKPGTWAEEWIEAERKEGHLQVFVKVEPFVDQELYDSRGDKSFGHITKLRKEIKTEPGHWYVQTTDGGDHWFEIVETDQDEKT